MSTAGGSEGPGPRITCVIPGLAVGGAEAVMTALANRWVALGWSVTILSFAGPEEAAFYQPDPRVVEQRMALLSDSATPLSGILRNLVRIRRLRQAIRATSPDAVLSFMDRTNVLTLLATVGEPWPIVVSERSNPLVSPGRVWGLLRSIAYRRARWIVVQTEGARGVMPARLRSRVTVVPNPVISDVARRASVPALIPGSVPVAATPSPAGPGLEPDADLVVALGRVVEEKGFDLLLRAFASVHARRPAARLEIWGDGPELASLEALRGELGLADAARFPGRTDTPRAVLARAAVFALSSHHEGFPNVLLEAMAEGVPPVAFACDFGPAEIVRDRVDGRLVPPGDVAAFADALAETLADPGARHAMGERARDVCDRFALERIALAWDALLVPASRAEAAA